MLTTMRGLAWVMLASILAACGPTPTSPPAGQPTAAPAAAPTAAPAAKSTSAAAQATTAPAAAPAAAGERTQLRLWTHSAHGNDKELATLKDELAAFNGQQAQYEVVYEAFPQASYNDSVAAPSVAGNLPCILDLDQPTVLRSRP